MRSVSGSNRPSGSKSNHNWCLPTWRLVLVTDTWPLILPLWKLCPAMPCHHNTGCMHHYWNSVCLQEGWPYKKVFNPAGYLATLLVRKAWWKNRFSLRCPSHATGNTVLHGTSTNRRVAMLSNIEKHRTCKKKQETVCQKDGFPLRPPLLYTLSAIFIILIDYF